MEIRTEIVYEDEHYSAIAFFAPLAPNDPVIRVYSEPHRDLMFEILSVGLLFWCKRKQCQRTRLLRWYVYNRIAQADEPPYKVLCVGGEGIWLDLWCEQADESIESIPAHLKAHKVFTLTSDMQALLAACAAFFNNQQYC